MRRIIDEAKGTNIKNEIKEFNCTKISMVAYINIHTINDRSNA